jgi:uncharacterized protein (TIGR02444 family)
MGEAFWRFALVLYSRPGVAEALLRLQDRDRCDINLILFALWAGAVLRRRLDPDALAVAEAAIEPIRDAVAAPARALRRRLKSAADPDTPALRRRVAALELAAERKIEERLACLVDAGNDGEPLAAAEANLGLCLGTSPGAMPEAAALLAALTEMVVR